MMKFVASTIRFENYSGDALTVSTHSIDKFRQSAEQSVSMFSAREQRVTSLRIQDDIFIADIAYGGQLAVDILGGPVESLFRVSLDKVLSARLSIEASAL